MGDIVNRLREWSSMHNPQSGASLITTEAADEIERLRTRVAYLEVWLNNLAPIMASDSDAIERLRALITAWADAEDALGDNESEYEAFFAAKDALRKAVGR